jgi:hypothetical protein
MDERTITVDEMEAARVKRVMDKTADAYSMDRYGKRQWRECVRLLLREGFTDVEAEAILRSKWMRWAADSSTHADVPSSADLARYLKTMTPKDLQRQVDQLVKETFVQGRALDR